MIPRSRLDLSWEDFASAASSCFLTHRRRPLEEAVRAATPDPESAFVALSVRSGFDVLLQALDFPEGTEVLVSAINIPDMGRIIRAHGLVPVPVDIDPATLEPLPASLEEALSPRSRALMVAHLFGAQLSLEGSRRFAKEHGLVFLEDCAQSYEPGSFWGEAGSDVRMVSFGPIKTDTALGGGVLLVRDGVLLRKMRRIQKGQPIQTQWAYGKRVLKYAFLQAVCLKPFFDLLLFVSRILGRTHDQVIGEAVRGFGPGELLGKIRQRPSGPQLAMLLQRLSNPGTERLGRRARLGESFAEALPPGIGRPGDRASVHTHWVFPILAEDPVGLMHFLWSRGFDATRGTSSLGLMETVPERPEVRPERATEILASLLFIPVYPEVPPDKLRGLSEALADYVREAQ